MSELGQWLHQKNRDKMLAALADVLPRSAVVASVSATGITVTDPLSGDVQDEILTMTGFRPDVGERVLMLTLADGERVALPLGTAGNLTLDGLLTMASGWNAQGVLKVGGVGLYGASQAGRVVYLTTTRYLGVISTVTVVADRMYYVPVFLPEDETYNALVFEITTLVAGSVQLGIYSATSSILPGAQIVACTKSAMASTGVKTMTITSTALTGGRWYMLGFASTTAMTIAGNVLANLPSPRGGSNSGGGTILMSFETLTAGWTAIPTTPGSQSNQSNMYLNIGVQVA